MLNIKGQPDLKIGDDFTKVISASNMVMEELYENLYTSSYPAFGSSMLHCDDQTIVATTCAHRVLSKYQRPDPSRTELLKAKCNQDWVLHEEKLKLHNYASLDYSRVDREILRRASIKLRSWLFKSHKQIEKALSGQLDRNVIEITPGETFISAEGEVSIYQKLVNKKYWTVTHDATESFIRLCYNNPWLKRIAKSHMTWLSRQEYNDLYWQTFSKDHQVGYHIFRQRMLDDVLTVVHGSRGSSVQKNNEKRRFINVECLGNVILQRCVALTLRDVLRKLGNDLEVGQHIHRERISKSISTIDFSNASDSILHDLIRLMWPTEMFKYLDRYRSPFCLVDGTYHKCHKLSSMGNGFTFEVMTITLLAIARVLDDDATVYGDDVIISNEHAEQFIRATECMGMTVNETKSFVGHRFRESCGGFYLDGYGYITCFDFNYIEHISDLIITCNKLKLMLDKNSGPWLGHYKVAYEALLRLVPSLFLGPVQSHFDGVNDQWVETERFRRSHMHDTTHRELYQTLLNQVQQSHLLQSFGKSTFSVLLSPRECIKEKTTAPKHLVYSMRRVKKFSSMVVDCKPTGKFCDIAAYEQNRRRQALARAAHYIYAGRRSADVVRVNEEDKLFEFIPYLVITSDSGSQVVDFNTWSREQQDFNPLYTRCRLRVSLHDRLCRLLQAA